MRRFPSLLLLAALLTACGDGEAGSAGDASPAPPVATLPEGAEAVSFLGETLYAPEQPEEVRSVYMERYREAEDALAAEPDDVEALIWMGRRTAYLGRYRDAIDIYTHAISLHPEDARLYRHRGHRYLSVRQPDQAIADFNRAAELTAGQPDEVEPDGLPNAMGIPTSTLQFNIWYHLGLAHYVKGDLEAALEAYRSCLDASVHPDSVVATSYWLYMTLRRLGMDEEADEVLAGIDEDMEIIESIAYLNLLLLFKGERTLEDLVGRVAPPRGAPRGGSGDVRAYPHGDQPMVRVRLPRCRRRAVTLGGVTERRELSRASWIPPSSSFGWTRTALFSSWGTHGCSRVW